MSVILSEAINSQAEFIEKLCYDDLPKEVIENAKLILLDSIACIAAGVKQYKVDALPDGKYQLLGEQSTDKYTATFIHGAAMVKNELDEGNQFAYGHPACHIIPALLSEVQDGIFTGKDIITALVAAYETSCRFGCSLKTKPAMHVHGTSQTMGACAVTGKLRGKKSAEIARAIVTASSLPQATSWNSAFDGEQLRNAYIGMSNLVGMNSYLMNEIGIDCSEKTMLHVWEKVLDGNINPDGLVEKLGDFFYIEKNYFKVYTACRYTHVFADMARELIKMGLDYKEIERIDIDTYLAASKLSGQTACNSFAMKFSIPVALATCFVFGDLSMDTVTDTNVADERVRELARKIFVKESSEYTALLPETRGNKMVVTLNNGKVVERYADVTKGDYKDPFSKADIIDKFVGLTKNIWDENRREFIINAILNLEECEDFSGIFEWMKK